MPKLGTPVYFHGLRELVARWWISAFGSNPPTGYGLRAKRLDIAEICGPPYVNSDGERAINMNVSLTDELGEFVKARVSTGRYGSASDVIRQALRLMELHEHAEAAKLKWLQEAYAVGIASGDAGELDFDAVKAEARRLPGKDVR